jgi:adenylate cyclase
MADAIDANRMSFSMDPTFRLQTINWLAGQGLAGLAENDLVRGFCERCCGAGMPLSRGLVFIDTLDPVFEGHGFRWTDTRSNESDAFDYGSTSDGEAAEKWRRSVFYHMLESDKHELHLDLADPATSAFSMLDEAIAKGHRHFAGFVHRFGAAGSIGQMDCVYSHWATRHPQGFDEPARSALRDLVPVLALAVKAATVARIARTVGRVYLGRDAAEQVMRGRISRGVSDWINAVLWFSDLRGSTAISEAIAPEEIIPFLNDYAEAAIHAVHDTGGDVLKLIGDGVLAVFTGDDMVVARRAALRAEHQFRKNMRAVNAKRSAANQLVTTAYVGLHVGEVFYGNIGSEDRLDFTVVGPAVNEVSRIASMCNSVERDFLASTAFQAGLDASGRKYFVSTGRFALRGIGKSQDLYTLDPEVRSDDGVAGRYVRYVSS